MIFIIFLSSFFFSISVSSSSPSSDFSALLSFKQSLLEPTFLLSSWLNSTNPCIDSWYGVTCNPTTHRVTRLVLENLNLNGPIHPLTQLSHLRLLSLKHNNLSCYSNLNFSSSPNLKHLYLSHNLLSGSFPAGFSHLRRLHRLDLSHNYFSGVIPMSELVSLPHLLTVRLEGNSFVGTIDAVNPLSPSVMEFNVSDNNLSGGIPAWLSRFPASSFAGNDNLCGEPLGRECSNQTVSSQPAELGNGTEKRASNWVVLMVVGIDAAAIAAAVVTITCCCRYYKRRRNDSRTHGEVAKKKGGSRPQIGGYYDGGGSGRAREGEEMVVFEGCKGFSDVDDLLKSSAELLGKGCVGTTYKVQMDGGGVVVVKRVRERRRRREVHGWMSIIGGLRHNNIVSLRAYYNSKEELLLVYDFLPNGSLHSLLHGNRGPGRTPLEWTTRLKLASGSAKGLAFLHGYNKAKLFHGNLTSSNILVDHLGNACIADTGLHQLYHSSFFLSAYKAPELMPNNNNSISIVHGKLSQKCDVYSFGVILLEILTGKMPSGEGETSLVRWVQRVRREEWSWEVFDFELLRCKEMEMEMVALMRVALLCLAPLPRDRPKMSMVDRMIEDIRTASAREEEGGSNSILNDLSSDSSPSVSENTF